MMKYNWQWFGTPGHFIGSSSCRFHLCTLIGDILVSTVGEYVPDSSVREIIAETRGVTLIGRGDAREASFMKLLGHQEIGAGRTYETMVFRASGPCKRKGCNCGLPEIVGSELDFEGYNERGAANKGHLVICEKWSKASK